MNDLYLDCLPGIFHHKYTCHFVFVECVVFCFVQSLLMFCLFLCFLFVSLYVHSGGYPNNAGIYPNMPEGLSTKDCTLVPGMSDVLCFAFRTDNTGPPENIDVNSYFSLAEINKKYFYNYPLGRKRSTITNIFDRNVLH